VTAKIFTIANWPKPPSHRTLRATNFVVAAVIAAGAVTADSRWLAMLLAALSVR
jgi:hypothetical protein